jgi:DNA polymerase III subunit delta
MRIKPEQLSDNLQRSLHGAYLVSGDEPLLVAEACDAIRSAARQKGFGERQLAFIDKGYDFSELRTATQSLSLFADKRLFELRMPTGKAGDGAELLEELIKDTPSDVLLLLVTGKLDKKAEEAAWVRALGQHGVWISVWPVAVAQLPAWLRGRARRLGFELDADAAEFIADRAEGNLLAAHQELEKLALLTTADKISIDTVMQSVGDTARYDVKELAAAAAAGEAERAMRILLGLKAEGVEPVLVLWAVTREIRGLYQSRERSRLRSNGRSAWNLASTPSDQALVRAGTLPLPRLLAEAGRVDRFIKSNPERESWTALTHLTAALAGALALH